MTVADLIAILQEKSPDQRILMHGSKWGYDEPIVSEAVVYPLDPEKYHPSIGQWVDEADQDISVSGSIKETALIVGW